jgi:hypothetical protein
MTRTIRLALAAAALLAAAPALAGEPMSIVDLIVDKDDLMEGERGQATG